MWLGPLIADSAEGAERLLRAAIASLPEGTTKVQMLVLDAPRQAAASDEDAAASEGVALVRRLGFEELGSPARLMVRGGVAPSWVGRVPVARAEGAPRPFSATGYEFG